MAVAQYQYEKLSTREGFNSSLIHFKAVSAMLGDFESQTNLADIVQGLIDQKTIEPVQIDAIVHALLVDKYGYAYRSINLPCNLTDFAKITEEVKKWKAVDVVLAYHHPELGLTVINPKNEDHWANVNLLKKDELAVIYVGAFNKEIVDKTANTALDTLETFLDGKSKKSPASLLKGSFTYKKPKKFEPEPETKAAKKPQKSAAKKPTKTKSTGTKKTEDGRAPVQAPQRPAPSAGPKKMSPMYSVPVTNELFHNGNVEAWKRIIQSYNTKHPDCEVYIFYEGERIHDINTLFKWGKVKHGSAILFAVAGRDIKDIAKLQRYLRQGASPRFEDFLRFPVNHVLNLF
jgi:hypothetical protein